MRESDWILHDQIYLQTQKVTMREIKFRGKRHGDGAWVYGSLYQGIKEGEKYSIILTDSGYHLAPPDDRNLAIAFAENEVNVVIPDTIGQFTGLHDRNGKEIYEGDIVAIVGVIKGYVRYNVRYWRYEIATADEPLENERIPSGIPEECWVVIGNIHDNPELL